MTSTFCKNLIVNLTFGILLFAGAASISAQTTAFTYQGRLTDNSMAANGSYDMQFKIHTAATGGAQQGFTVTKIAVPVSNGAFTVQVDMSNSPFVAGDNRYLEISVRLNGSGDAYTTLAPRQQITSAPYAVQSIGATFAVNAQNADALGNVAASQYVQTTDARLTDARTPTSGSANYVQNSATTQAGTTNFNINGNGTVGGTLTTFNASVSNNLSVQGNITAQGAFTGNGSGLTALNGANISSGTVSIFRIPDLSAAKITSGTFVSSLIPILDASKITTGTFATAQIPSLDASKITSGSFAAAQIPSLDTSKITTGTLEDTRLSANIPRLNVANQTFTGNQTINGNVSQPLAANGLPKAMIYIDYDFNSDTYYILRCYNGLTGSTAVPCGFTLTYNSFNTTLDVNFGLPVVNRFYSYTQEGIQSDYTFFPGNPNNNSIRISDQPATVIIY